MADDEGRYFVIDGGHYPLPDVSSMDMAERRVMYDLAGLVQEDFIQDDDEDDAEHDARVTRLTRHPGFMESLMHIAYQRGHPELKRDRVQKVIDKTRFVDAVADWADDIEEDDVNPPELTKPPDGSSPSETDISNASSGASSMNGSALPDSLHEPIGVTRSDISFPVSAPTTTT